ncbi:hypothetical protein E2C01_035011 [Portunus trituberculatus]|uniref:Uncharacterized protein n=1 Tax=Portunus trituberculatus TaxID=210409 RepID=A0A5B7F319_PORTR|nr:hypothetical protein [Portunus trituberculatus]
MGRPKNKTNILLAEQERLEKSRANVVFEMCHSGRSFHPFFLPSFLPSSLLVLLFLTPRPSPLYTDNASSSSLLFSPCHLRGLKLA